jgi:beta-lactam-binding protein with PASTA domain
MANWRTIAAAAAAGIAITATSTACKNTTDTGSSSGAPSFGSTSSADDGKATSKTLPNFVGMGLQSAQDKAQAAGFYALASHDSLGRDRMQILDRDWKVCSQTPAAGKAVPADTKLDFGTVKVGETCPDKDAGTQAAAGATMPNFTGKAVKVARGALDSGTSITVNDATGDGRFVLLESNWKVCSQNPKAGAALNGQPVTLNAVKFEESCS